MKTHITLATYKKEARDALAGKWVYAAVTTLVWSTVSVILSVMDNTLPFISLIIGFILMYGYTHYVYNIAKGERADTELLFAGFSNRFGTILFAGLIMTIKALLWSLLLIVPGIIAAISYSQTFFILRDDDKIDAYSAVEKSKKMMYGHKWSYFLLSLSFVPWMILSILTFFIGFFFSAPYYYVATARFYVHLKNHTETAELA